MLYNYVSQGHLLLATPLLKASLHDTATVLVSADLLAVAHASIEDELGVGGPQL